MVLNLEVGIGEPTFLGGKKISLKSTILLHKQTKRRFHLTVFVLGEKDDSKNYGDATFARHGTHFTTSNGNTYLWKNMSLQYMF